MGEESRERCTGSGGLNDDRAAAGPSRGDGPACARQRSEENLRRAERIAKFGNWEWNILTNELLWSEEVYRLYGMDPDKGKPSYDVVMNTLTPECRDRFVQAVQDTVEHGARFEGEYRMISLDGTVRHTHTVGEVVRDRAGKPVSMFGVMHDITDRKRMEESLRKTSETLGAIVRYSPLAVICTDADGNVLMWNPAAERFFGWSEQEVLGRDNPIVPPEKAEEYRSLQERVRSGQPYVSKQLERRRKDGSSIILNASSAPLYDDNGAVIGLVGMFEDITERKRAV